MNEQQRREKENAILSEAIDTLALICRTAPYQAGDYLALAQLLQARAELRMAEAAEA